MSSTADPPAKAVPAQLAFLAIYNPSLGTTDETLDDQIVYYTSKDSRNKGRKRDDVSKEEQNERLRQIGLAQGMVDFGKNFSEGRSVDTIETEKSRIVLYELEVGWWILASIDLTRLPAATSKDTPVSGKPSIEYSSREVKPAALLLQDLVRAHQKFLLHHASSVSALFVRNQRQKFLGIFGRYWDSFTATWNVLLHGNPAINIYGGIKLAACGELGVGVGEEERGSGERAVLEGLASSVEGLVDVVVCKFGEAERKNKVASHVPPTRPWLGSGQEPSHEDGAIFLGIGALSRDSLRDITHWMEDLYTWGSEAYGVLDNPSSTRRKKVRRHTPKVSPLRAEPPEDDRPSSAHEDKESARKTDGSSLRDSSPASPGVLSTHRSSSESTSRPRQAPSIRKRIKDRRPTLRRAPSSNSITRSITPSGKLFNYLKLGYGTHWSLTTVGSASTSKEPDVETLQSPSAAPNKVTFAEQTPAKQNGTPDSTAAVVDYFMPLNENSGHYLIGLMGDIEHDTSNDTEAGPNESPESDDGNARILLRTLTVELEREGDVRAEADISIDLGTSDTASKHGSERTGTSTHASFESQDRNKTKKLRVVVYVSRPFMFTFLFEQRTDSLSWPSLYRSLHLKLGPLQKPLLKSTSYRGPKPTIISAIPNSTSEDEKSPIYDIVWDPKTLTISSSLPDIPSPLLSYTSAEKQPWSRLEALNTHSQILATYIATRHSPIQYERTCKTSRGYWISWTRIPDPETLKYKSLSLHPRDTNTNTPSSSTYSPRRQSPSRCGTLPRDRSKASQSRGGSTIPTRASEVSGPAHPFLDFSEGREGDGLAARNWDKEIFLVRRASDYGGGGLGSGVGGGWGGGEVGWMGEMGLDTKRYIEGLLNLR